MSGVGATIVSFQKKRPDFWFLIMRSLTTTKIITAIKNKKLSLFILDMQKKMQKGGVLIKTNPEDSMKQARTIYNQTIMSEMLSWNTPDPRL